MRLSIFAAAVPALLSIACDGPTQQESAPTAAAQRAERPSFRPRAEVHGFAGFVAPDRVGLDLDRWGAPADAWTGPQRGRGSALPVPTTTPVEAPPEATCSTITMAGFAAIDAARTSFGACSSNADCTIDFVATSCGGVDLHAVSFAGASGFEEAMQGIEANICATLGDACPIAIACFFSQPTAACVEGQCQLGEPTHEDPGAACDNATEHTTIEGCLECTASAQKAQSAMNAVVAELDACEVDSDCVQASDDTGCGSTCGVAVNVANLADFNEARANLGADYCAPSGCPVYAAGCLPQEAKCDAGRCALVGTW